MPYDLPTHSWLAAEQALYPFRDCHSSPLGTCSADGQALLRGFAQGSPPWVDALMRLRNRIVAPLRLKTGNPSQTPEDKLPSVGERLGVFRVLHIGPHETVLGEDDRHLDFRISLMAVDGELRVATLVRPHNVGGRLYLTLVLPFHYLISRRMTGQIARQLASAG